MGSPLPKPKAVQVSQSGTYPRVAIRRVLARPHPALSRRAADVDPCDPAVVALADVLVNTMRASPACVGLAATQVGEASRVFAMDVTGHRRARSCAGLVVMVNPRVVARSNVVIAREGCMSVPHLTGNVARAAAVTVDGLEPGTGRAVRVDADAIEARCLQHEIDHLDGFVFVDRVSDPKKDLFARKDYAEDPMFATLKQAVTKTIDEAVNALSRRGNDTELLVELGVLASEAGHVKSSDALEEIAERAELLLGRLGSR